MLELNREPAMPLAAPIRKSYLRLFHLAKAFNFVNTPGADAIERTVRDLQTVQGSALLIGGLAVAHHGFERTTEDVDILYETRDSNIVKRLRKFFTLVRKASNGWIELRHNRTNVRLELVPEGGLGQYGFIPFCSTVGQDHGFISLLGLIWLKLVAGRPKDDIDLIELLKINLSDSAKIRAQLPSELHARFDEFIGKVHATLDNDPYLHPENHMKRKLPDGTIVDLSKSPIFLDDGDAKGSGTGSASEPPRKYGKRRTKRRAESC